MRPISVPLMLLSTDIKSNDSLPKKCSTGLKTFITYCADKNALYYRNIDYYMLKA